MEELHELYHTTTATTLHISTGGALQSAQVGEVRKDMGGVQSSSCFSAKSQRRYDDAEREPRYTSRKVRPSDEDRGRYVGDPDVDTKASKFIAKFHESRFMDLSSQTVAV